MMRNVYSKATEVLVWLGESSKEMTTPDPVAQSIATEQQNTTTVSRLILETVVEQEQNNGNSTSVNGWSSLNEALSRYLISSYTTCLRWL